jgi:hypothetical protein
MNHGMPGEIQSERLLRRSGGVPYSLARIAVHQQNGAANVNGLWRQAE